MSRHTQKPAAVFLRYFAVLSLLVFSTDTWSMTVSPSWSLGNYTVSWPSWGATGCTYYEPYPGWPAYACYWLEEKAGAGGWVGVSTPNYATSWSASGKPSGTYQYRLQYAYGDYYSGYQYVADGPVSVQVGVPPLPLSEQQQYVSRHGDLDGDGDIDLYIKRIFGTSWQLPIAELVLRRNANGTFNVETTVTQTIRDIVNAWGISSTLATLVDFNADGYMDVLVTGLSLANAGPYDVIAFAANGPGAPPPSARLIDDSVQKFLTDTLAYLADPNYFNDGYQYSCWFQWINVPGWRWDIDGQLHFYTLPVPDAGCWWYPNPNYSYAALQVAPSLGYVLERGTVVPGSWNEVNVGHWLGDVFGTTFMGGSLSTGLVSTPTDWVIEQFYGPESVLGPRRLARIAGALFEMRGALPMTGNIAGPHSYGCAYGGAVNCTPIITPICREIDPGCGLQTVYEEVLKFPVWGHAAPDPGQPDPCNGQPRSFCDVPVVDGESSMVEAEEYPGDNDDFGEVVHTVLPNQYELVNTTVDGHVFHPGEVHRRVFNDNNGFVSIRTWGSGTGRYPTLNEAVAPGVWKSVDAVIKARIEWDMAHP